MSCCSSVFTSFFGSQASSGSGSGSSDVTYTAQSQNYVTGTLFSTGVGGICPVQPTQSGTYAIFNLTNSNVTSGLPHQCAYFSAPVRDVFGNVDSITLSDLKQIVLRTRLDAPPSGVVLWAVVTSGALGATSNGFGVKIDESAGSWRVGGATNAGSAWGTGSATANTTTTVGAVGHAPYGVSNQQVSRAGAFPLDASDAKIGTTSTGWTAANTANVGNGLDTLSFGCGWLDGAASKPATASISIKVDLIAAKLADFNLPAR